MSEGVEHDVYDGVIRLFALPSSSLVPIPFKQLYRGEPPDDAKIPFAVLTPTGDENVLGFRSRQHEWHRGTFTIEIADRTEEAVSHLGWQVRQVFIDGDLAIDAMKGVVPLRALTHKSTKGPDQQAPDLWLAELTFDLVYPVARPHSQ
jgi:hypothetical protein